MRDKSVAMMKTPQGLPYVHILDLEQFVKTLTKSLASLKNLTKQKGENK
jgi:hypothetical protein